MLAPFVSTFSRIRSPSGLAVVLDRIRDNLSHRVLFYSIGTDANTDVQDIEDAVKNLSRSSRTSVGCLTRRLSLSEQTISLSLAAFDEDVCTVFSSTEVGDEIVQVGRWHSSTGRGVAENAGVPWDLKFPNGGFEDGDYWERAKRQRTSCPVPGELEALNASTVHGLIYFTSSRSPSLADALAQKFPDSPLFGISASSTPFLTGLPHTLIRDGKPQSVGSVGIALQERWKAKVSMRFNNLEELSDIMTVTDSEGNLIQSLNDANPARLLLQLLQSRGETMRHSDDQEYYIGLHRPNREPKGMPDRLVRVVAGDPSRGSIALENSSAPPVGSELQFYRRSITGSPSTTNTISLDPIHKNGVRFICNVSEDSDFGDSNGVDHPSLDNDAQSDGTFLVRSENGFTLDLQPSTDTQAGRPWHCSVPSSVGSLELFDVAEVRKH